MAKADVSPSNDEAKWRAESDLRTLTEAKKIQKDAKRMAAVRKLAKEEIARMESLADK